MKKKCISVQSKAGIGGYVKAYQPGNIQFTGFLDEALDVSAHSDLQLSEIIQEIHTTKDLKATISEVEVVQKNLFLSPPIPGSAK